MFGALFIQFVPNIADSSRHSARAPRRPGAIYGVMLIAFMYVMPTGVAGFSASWRLIALAGALSGRPSPDMRRVAIAKTRGKGD